MARSSAIPKLGHGLQGRGDEEKIVDTQWGRKRGSEDR